MRQAAFGRRAKDARKGGGGFGRSGTGEPAQKSAQKSAKSPSPKKAVDKPGPPTAEEKAAEAMLNSENAVDRMASLLEPKLPEHFPVQEVKTKSRSELTEAVEKLITETAQAEGVEVTDADLRDLTTYFLNDLLEQAGHADDEDPLASDGGKKGQSSEDTIMAAKERVQPLLMEHIDPSAATELPRAELAEQVGEVVGELLVQEKINLNLREQRNLVTVLLNDMLGLGPLEPLLADDDISDIMVNGPNQVYVEKKGKLDLTEVRFRDEQHLLNIASRIVTAVGRRVDESSPICDARLADGSRVNVIIPPLAIDGTSISIRKFAKQKITLDTMLEFGSLSPKVATVLKIAGACRLNILISGGTGSGKTTMLNAISRMIDRGERVVTIEDAAELQMMQPHVVRLETRPPNLEGSGEVSMRDLVKNALRMRPERIILGEIRGGEAIDMLQAMNTGHDGSMGTIHANRPREALTRLENMVNMAGLNLPIKAIREQVASSLDMIVQVSRMRDGGRRVQYVTEVVGMEGDVITTQDLFKYEFIGEDENGKLMGEFKTSGVRPHFMTRAEYFGLGRALMEAMS